MQSSIRHGSHYDACVCQRAASKHINMEVDGGYKIQGPVSI